MNNYLIIQNKKVHNLYIWFLYIDTDEKGIRRMKEQDSEEKREEEGTKQNKYLIQEECYTSFSI